MDSFIGELSVDEMLISIIVPVYNVEKYVLKCLQSIQNQTYQNFEVIIVDDGSIDGGGEICDKFAESDKRFGVIHQSNMGLSAARNTGLEVAKGEFLMFVDSDDYIHPQMLEILYRCCVEKKAEVAVCKYLTFGEGEDVNFSSINWDACDTMVVSGIESCQRIYTETVCETVISCNKLYRREVFEKMRFPVGKIHEDEFVTYKILYDVEKVVYVDEVLYFYLQRQNSIMSQTNYGSNHMVMLEMARESILFYLSKNNKRLAELALERAYGLCKMLYEKYGIAKRKDLQKVVLECYRSIFEKFHGLVEMSKAQEFTTWLYGYYPVASQNLSDLYHRLWLLKHHK